MVDRSAPQTGGSTAATPVVLCCASGEAEALAALVGALEQRGNPVDVVTGVEADTRALATAIERRAGAGLYVVVRSGALDREKVDALREVLLAQRVPFGRTLTVSGTKLEDLLERIEQSLRRQVAHAPGSRTPSGTPVEPVARSRRTTALITSAPPKPAGTTTATASAAGKPSAPTAAKPATRAPAPRGETNVLPVPRPPPPRPRTPAPASASATPAETSSEPQSSTPTLPGAAERSATQPAPPAGVAGPDEQTRTLAVSEDVAPGDAMVGEIQSVVAPLPEPDTSMTAMELDAELVEDVSIHPLRRSDDEDDPPTDVDLAGVLDGIGVDAIDRTAPGRRVDTVVAPAIAFEGYPEDDIELSLRDGVIVEGYDKVDVTQIARAPLPPPAPTMTRTAPSARTVSAAAVEEDGSRWRYVAGAVVAALGLGVLAAVMVSDDDTDEDGAVIAAASTATPPADDAPKPEAKPVPDAKPEPKAKPEPAAKPEPEAKPEPAAKPVPEAKPEPAAKPVPEAKPPVALADASTLARPAESARGSGLYTVAARKAERARPIPPARTAVLAALRGRSIRALDVLLVTRRATAPMAATAAAPHCEALELDGLGDWRLPEIGELASLTDAGMIGRGFYWSSTAGDTFGDSRMAWNGAKRQGGVRYKSSAVLCVRGDRWGNG